MEEAGDLVMNEDVVASDNLKLMLKQKSNMEVFYEDMHSRSK